MDEEKLLFNSASRQKTRVNVSARLGAEADGYLSRRQGALKRNAPVVDLWQEILPLELQSHCSLSGISENTVHLEVEPGPYLYELGLMKEELVAHIQRHCPGAGIRNIKIRPAGSAIKFERR